MEKASQIHQDHLVSVVGITAAASLIYSCYYLYSSYDRCRNAKFFKEIPTPKSHFPYLGHMLALSETPSVQINQWHDELGPIMKLRMGRRTWVMVNDPLLAYKIFVNNSALTSYRPKTVYGFGHYGMQGKGVVFAQPNIGHRKNRAAALSLLAPKQIANFAANIKEESANLVTRLLETTEKEGSVDPLKDLQFSALNVILDAVFGKRFTSVDDDEFCKLLTIEKLSMKYANLQNDLPYFLPIISFFGKYFGRQSMWNKFMTKERNPTYRKLITQAMLSETPNFIKDLEENGFAMTIDEKTVFVSDMLTGGTDTIPTVLSWNFVIMCRHPETQKKTAAEIDTFVSKYGRLPTFEERLEVPFCVSVIKECMRYKPATYFGLPHTLHQDIEVDGYLIKKDTAILTSMHSMHLNPNYFTDPEKFIPDRFINNLRTMQACANGRIEERDHYNFGWGRRICPGISLAESEIFTAFIQVYSTCFIEPADKSTMPDIETLKCSGLTILPRPQKLRFLRRDANLV